MTWEEYYYKASYVWGSDVTKASQISEISNLEEADPEQIVELMDADLDEKAGMKLLRKASRAGVRFNVEQIEHLFNLWPDVETVCELTLSNETLTFTPEKFIEFIDYDLPLKYLKMIASRLNQNLNADQLDELYSMGFDEDTVAALARKAGLQNPYGPYEEADEDEIEEVPPIRGAAGIGILAGLSSVFAGKKKQRCTGNCAACPPHYGYRYGRWYYGHGHDWGCEFKQSK